MNINKANKVKVSAYCFGLATGALSTIASYLIGHGESAVYVFVAIAVVIALTVGFSAVDDGERELRKAIDNAINEDGDAE